MKREWELHATPILFSLAKYLLCIFGGILANLEDETAKVQHS